MAINQPRIIWQEGLGTIQRALQQNKTKPLERSAIRARQSPSLSPFSTVHAIDYLYILFPF